MDIKITRASKEDLKVILQLQKLAYEKEAKRYNDFTIPPMTQTPEEIESEHESTIFLKLMDGGKIIGSIKGRKTDNTCHVGRLMVHPEYRGKGYGKKLVMAQQSPGALRDC
jgi:ribosomal protein S18 acetylase RimI-like enzyme